MNGHPIEHEEFLANLLAGERRPEEPDVARRLRECPRCREQWTLLRDTAARLECTGAERRVALDELEWVGPAPGEERVLATLAGLAAEDAEVRRPPRRSLVWLAAAILLVLGAWIARRFLAGEGERRDPTWLGRETLHLGPPLEGVPRFESFSWTYDGDGAASFTLRIYGLDGGAKGEPLFERERLKETTWTPDAELQEKLPSRILWQVDVLDEFRVVLASASASAWLSSR